MAKKDHRKPDAPAPKQERGGKTADHGHRIGTQFGQPRPESARRVQTQERPSEAGSQQDVESVLERPAGDGTYLRSGDREEPLGGIAGDED